MLTPIYASYRTEAGRRDGRGVPAQCGAVRELCIEKGIFTAEEHRRFTEFAEQIGPTQAAPLMAKTWLDPELKKLALADPMAASKEAGVDWLEPTGFGAPSDFTAFQILEDTPRCTT